MKVIKNIFERKLRKVLELDEMHMGFIPGRGTTDTIFIIRQLVEKYEVAGRNLYMIFVDLEKAFDRVPREVIRWSLRRKGVLERKTKAIMEMYTNIKTSVKVECSKSDPFDIVVIVVVEHIYRPVTGQRQTLNTKVRVHQESILNPLLFALVMDEVTKGIREGVVKEMLCADDIVLVGHNWKRVEY